MRFYPKIYVRKINVIAVKEINPRQNKYFTVNENENLITYSSSYALSKMQCQYVHRKSAIYILKCTQR